MLRHGNYNYCIPVGNLASIIFSKSGKRKTFGEFNFAITSLRSNLEARIMHYRLYMAFVINLSKPQPQALPSVSVDDDP